MDRSHRNHTTPPPRLHHRTDHQTTGRWHTTRRERGVAPSQQPCALRVVPVMQHGGEQVRVVRLLPVGPRSEEVERQGVHTLGHVGRHVAHRLRRRRHLGQLADVDLELGAALGEADRVHAAAAARVEQPQTPARCIRAPGHAPPPEHTQQCVRRPHRVGRVQRVHEDERRLRSVLVAAQGAAGPRLRRASGLRAIVRCQEGRLAPIVQRCARCTGHEERTGERSRASQQESRARGRQAAAVALQQNEALRAKHCKHGTQHPLAAAQALAERADGGRQLLRQPNVDGDRQGRQHVLREPRTPHHGVVEHLVCRLVRAKRCARTARTSFAITKHGR